MILQALSEYYQRKTREGSNELPPIGFEKKEIPFLIVLDEEGYFVDLEDTRTGKGKKKTGRIFIVPQGEKRTSGILPNLLWDTLDYVLGTVSAVKAERLEANKREKEQQRAKEKRAAFIQRIKDTFPEVGADKGIKAVLAFLEKGDFQSLYNHSLWDEINRSTGNLSFRLQNSTELICQRNAVRRAIAEWVTERKKQRQRCLVSGEVDTIARVHPPIRGVRGAQPSGADIVSFNRDAFTSYGKHQGINAPVGERVTFAYTTALNHLLRKGSRQRIQVGDASTVFWAAKDHPSEEQFVAWLDPDPDDPDRGTEAIRALYAAPKSGAKPIDEDDTPFYVLGLAPNAARIAVRFWYPGTVGEVARHIRQHFDDTHIIHAPQEPEFLPLFRLLKASALQGKVENVPPNLAGDFMKAILVGMPYPRTLLAAALRRVRAEHHITYPRVALIKAVLTRNARLFNHPQQEVNVALDLKNLNIGYRLGRLFAVLERVQNLALPNVEATIRDRFYSAASSTPRTAFPHLLKLKNYHLDKLEEGQIIWLEKLMGEIMDGIEYFPAHLSLDDQGRFTVGYYHQRQAFFNKKNLDN
ncbi:type I-C CRISPR-associated protein Cas8c/Csd1 [Nitrosococcus wardiae]|uniref:Type I-C CRISPR-associated protein Cas8c/Csd1 n=1 Tax=Nitrosococcus wardiae TaxID=1814290 RepID=A0A4P7C1D6_9GAMM|nr:type I-C CRISPR-associated protein Cas8c/Csd1 [Nitrosococcus wardiae]QBQ55264.1 type I-C CRISPR-associated protein Cas8c/Csd1 [Nitrosococcus wardiae]